MVSNEFRKKCRDIGLLAEHIVCMADCYEEPVEKFRKSLLYENRFEDRQNIILDMIDTGNRIAEEIKEVPLKDLRFLHEEQGVALMDYVDMLTEALRREPYANNEVKFKCDAIISIILDIVHREMRSDDVYKKLAEGELNENVQIQLLP